MGGEDKQRTASFQERVRIVASKLIEVFSLLSINKKLDFIENGQVSILLSDRSKLLTITSSSLAFPDIPIPQTVFSKPSSLSDYFVPNTQIEAFINLLTEKDLIIRLNHIGFCYLVDSKKQERERLKIIIERSKWKLYQEDSNDLSDWFFLGDKTIWQDPLVEFVPTEMNHDRWRDYWLPHISIDIDTALTGEEIEELVRKTFAGKVPPYRLIVVNGNICVIRARLGTVSGVNVYFDLGTVSRNTQYHREHLLKQIN